MSSRVRDQDEGAGTVGKSASKGKAPKSKWSARVTKDDAGSIGEGARDDDEGKSKSARE
jgi:hypothetical protein